MALRIRRGTDAERQTITPLAGELIYSTDTKTLHIGDGTTAGGTLVGPDSGYIAEVSDDTSPQLGGDLDLNGNNITGTGNININGTITATGNINLGDGVEDNVIVGGVIASDLTPSGFYDLGDPTKRWNTVWANSIDVSTTITAGDVNADLIADDSTVVFNSSTGILSGTFNGTVDGELTGSVFADDSRLLVDGVNGVIPGPVITGAISAAERIFTTISTDSNTDGGSSANFTRIFDDANAAVVNISKSRGTIGAQTAVQAGDQIGLVRFVGYDGSDVYGCAAIIGSADPDGTVSTGVIPGKLEFQTYSNAGTPITRAEIDYNGSFKTYGIHWGLSTAPTGIPFYSLNNSNIVSDGPRLLMRRSRGTFDTPLAVASGDVLHRLTWGGHDGTNYQDTAFITGSVDGTVSAGVIPTKLEVKTTDSSGSVQTNMTYEVDGTTSLGGAITMATYADPTARDAAIPSPTAGMVVFLTDSTGSSGPAKFQGNTDGTTGGWVDLH